MKRQRRCVLCLCNASLELNGFPVCRWHYRNGESDPPCPVCQPDVDYRWTFTTTGEPDPRKVVCRQIKLSNTVFLEDKRETVLDIVCVNEPAPAAWPYRIRKSVVMIGLGQQLRGHFFITQWATDWEQALFDAVRPSLALASRIYTTTRGGNIDGEILSGHWVSARHQRWNDKPLWPAIDIRDRMVNVRTMLRQQQIGPCVDRTDDIRDTQAIRYWLSRDRHKQEAVWKHNYLNVLEMSKQIFQLEWPQTGDRQ